MHDGVQCDLIQGRGHEPLKVGNAAIFKGYLLPQGSYRPWKLLEFYCSEFQVLEKA